METFFIFIFYNTYNESNTTTNFERNTTLQEEKVFTNSKSLQNKNENVKKI